MRFVRAALLVAVFSARAWAGETDAGAPPVALALGAGAAVAIAPLCAGGVTFADRDELSFHKAGIYTALTGLTLAPLTSHLLVHEWKRALYFSIAPLVADAVVIGAVESHPELFDHGHPAIRVTFGAALSVAVLGAIVGVADSAGAKERWRRRQRLVASSGR